MTAHPAWCSPNLCDATDPNLPDYGGPDYGGAHRSEPIDLDTRRLSVGHAMVQATSASLYQAAAPWTVETFLLIRADGVELSMPISQAAGVLSQLAQLVAANAR